MGAADVASAATERRGRAGGEVTLVVIDDQVAVGHALARALSAEPELAVVGVASSLHEGVMLIARREPDVAVVSLRRDGSGADVVERVAGCRAPTRVLLYTGIDEASRLITARECGAAGIVHTTGTFRSLCNAIRTVAGGEHYVDPLIASSVERSAPLLTAREREIMELVATGMTDEEIAEQLCLSHHTVQTHLRNVRSRLGARNRAHSVALTLKG